MKPARNSWLPLRGRWLGYFVVGFLLFVLVALPLLPVFHLAH